jgi:DUF1680 family protein
MKNLVFLLLLSLLACTKVKQEEKPESRFSDYPINPVSIRDVKVTDDFWLPIIQTVQQRTISYALEKCKEEGRFDNFLIAGGVMEGETKGYMPFDDTDVYKIIEGASNSLISSPNEQLEVLLDSLIAIVKIGQEEDGYLTTWRTINPAKPPAPWVKVGEGKRWSSLDASHEFYNSGHMYEAAAVHFEATGKRNFLDIALKNADLLVETFGPDKIQAVPGHQIVETGLVKLYRITNNEKYLQLARYFLDQRGDSTARKLYGPYNQDHLPVTQQNEVVGHAVRAVYMYAGMTDIAALYADEAYKSASDNLWENMVNKKMYITGGIGARHDGEAFGENYELPNLTAYSETCAAIGSVYWNHRLFMLTGDVKYYDVIERTLYNGLISGISIDGVKFFYPNALESDGVYTFNQGACTRKEWFDCSCCPTNVIRFIPAVPGLIYSTEADTLFVNLYASNQASALVNNSTVLIEQTTNYPWDGNVKIKVTPEKEEKFTIKPRVPGWARLEVLPGDLYAFADENLPTFQLLVNGEPVDKELRNGYLILSKTWGKGDEIELDFSMKVRMVRANEKVEEDRGKLSLEYGPMVYAVEEIDNPGSFDSIHLSGEEKFSVIMNPDLLGGVNVLDVSSPDNSFKAIPYYAWSNRGIGKMKVWLPVEN